MPDSPCTRWRRPRPKRACAFSANWPKPPGRKRPSDVKNAGRGKFRTKEYPARPTSILPITKALSRTLVARQSGTGRISLLMYSVKKNPGARASGFFCGKGSVWKRNCCNRKPWAFCGAMSGRKRRGSPFGLKSAAECPFPYSVRLNTSCAEGTARCPGRRRRG